MSTGRRICVKVGLENEKAALVVIGARQGTKKISWGAPVLHSVDGHPRLLPLGPGATPRDPS